MNVSEQMKEQIKLAAIEAQKFTCQLFYNLKKIGSGFFVEIDGNYFMISAAHVLEQKYINNMMFPNGKELVTINGELIITTPPKGEELHADDPIDFSIIKLSSKTVNEIIKQFSFMTIDLIEIDHEPQNGPQYMLFGYPNIWTKVIASEEKFIPKPLIVRTKIIDADKLSMVDYVPKSKFIVEYDPCSFTNYKEGITLPESTGMSGSALWYIPFQEFDFTGKLELKLIGLITDFHGGMKSVIAATNITLITELIRQKMGIKIQKSSKIKVNIKNTK